MNTLEEAPATAEPTQLDMEPDRNTSLVAQALHHQEEIERAKQRGEQSKQQAIEHLLSQRAESHQGALKAHRDTDESSVEMHKTINAELNRQVSRFDELLEKLGHVAEPPQKKATPAGDRMAKARAARAEKLAAAKASAEAPKKRGWPKGKPRGSKKKKRG